MTSSLLIPLSMIDNFFNNWPTLVGFLLATCVLGFQTFKTFWKQILFEITNKCFINVYENKFILKKDLFPKRIARSFNLKKV